MTRLPPLTALRAFESAARHQSFTKAARELCLTQSAVSRHVRNLEELFGIPLFFRDHRTVTLTPEGLAYMQEVVEAFARIDLATRKLKSSGKQNVLKLHAYTTFAMNWLIPRLPRFQDQNPEIDVRLTASVAPLDFDRTDIHAAIRTDAEKWPPGVRADKLFDCWLVPVAGPHGPPGNYPLRQPADLRHATLLHSLARPDDWRLWLASAGATDVDPDRGLKFESSAMAYLAAQQGMGIAIAQSVMVQEEFKKGLLKPVFAHAVRSDRTYYMLTSPRHAGDASLALFREWLLAELPKEADPVAALAARPPAD